MTRTHRTLHRIVWPILAALLALGFTLALWLRPPPEEDKDETHAVPPAIVLERSA